MNKQSGIKIVVGLLVVSLLVFLGLGLKGEEVAGIGETAIDFELEDVNGNIYRLSDYEGQVVVLNFFASWCKPCVDEAPELEAFGEEYNEQAKLLIIAKGEPRDRVLKFIEEHESSLIYLLDYNMEVAKTFNTLSQPETIIIDKEGIIRDHMYGIVTKELLAEKIQKYQ